MEHSHTRSFVLSESCVASKAIWPSKPKILSRPSEKEFVDFCSGYFLPVKIYLCSWQAAVVPTTSSHLNPGKGLTVTARAILVPVSSYCWGVPVQNRFTRAPLPWQAEDTCFCHYLPERLSNSPVPQPFSCIFHDLQTPNGEN